MSGTDGGFILPENVDPPTFCMTLEVPDDPQYIASLAGALWELQYWWNWQRDNAHTAVPVTRLWRRLIQEAFDRINAGHLCPVPSSINVAEMEYEMSICEQLRFHNGKLQGLCCGEWSDIAGQGDISIGGPEQIGGGAPQPTPGGGCQTYHAQFDAKSQYLVPTVVNSGDTVTFSNASGGGHDGAVGVWNCPNGQTLFGPACVGVGGPQAGDPATAVDHMALVAKIGATWYPAFSGVITVPGGVSNAQIVIQVNDDPLSDNSGSYALDVEVCNHQTLPWMHEFDFTLSPAGFVDSSGGVFAPVWLAGQGWSANAKDVGGGSGWWKGATIKRTGITAFTGTRIEMDVNFTVGFGPDNSTHIQNVDPWFDYLLSQSVQGAGITIPFVGTQTGIVEIDINQTCDWKAGSSGACTGVTLIKKLRVWGTGVQPTW